MQGLVLESTGHVRRLLSGQPNIEQYGLLELMDNNPVVCAEEVSLPSLAASLFLIALGPLLLSGLVTESPSFITNLACDQSEIQAAAGTVGWHQDVDVMTEPLEVSGTALGTGLAVVRSISDPEEFAAFYLERFGKSGVIRVGGGLEWSPDQVRGKPLAIYRVSVSPDMPHSLLSVQVMADATGAFQRAQLITAMNVMYGFEDELGLTLRQP
jgi:N-acetyl-gamma-glutamylphosphate reductase